MHTRVGQKVRKIIQMSSFHDIRKKKKFMRQLKAT